MAPRLLPLVMSRWGPNPFHLLNASQAPAPSAPARGPAATRCPEAPPQPSRSSAGLQPDACLPRPAPHLSLSHPLPDHRPQRVSFASRGGGAVSPPFHVLSAWSFVWNAPFRLVASYSVFGNRSGSVLLTGSGATHHRQLFVSLASWAFFQGRDRVPE